MIPNIGLFSYSVSSIGYLVLAILLLISWRGRIEGGMLLVAVMVQFISSGLIAIHSVTDYFSTYNIFIFEVSKVFAWVVFMLRLLGSGSDQKILPYLKNIFYLITIISLYIVIFEQDFIIKLKIEYNIHVLKLVMLTFSIFGLVLVEQIYRNIQPEKKWEIKFLCIGLAALFAYDIYLYSNISLFEGVNQTLWDARGIVNALSIPLIAISAKRNAKWSFDIFVSRHIVFYSAGVVTIGIYLILMSAAGYYLKSYGGTWGGFAQIIFLVGAILILIVVMSSGVTRAKIRVFLSKHFYKNKYDYRDEWLRLIHNISEYKSAKHFKDNIIQTVAGILRCRGGVLFLEGAGCFQCDTSWNCPDPVNKISFSSSLIRFLNKYEWIIDVGEYKINQDYHYNLNMPDWILEMQDAWLIVPLKHNYKLLGFFLLLESSVSKSTNWEDRDLLKAVGRQVSSYLAFIQASEALNQAEQFAAFNRFSAYIVHDLKNLVTQLELIVKNAEEHKGNPDFIADSFLTVSNVVARMQKMLSQFKQKQLNETDARAVDVEMILSEIIESHSTLAPKPELQMCEHVLHVYVEPERFKNIIEHLVQNAQEATKEDGYVKISVDSDNDYVNIKVEDNGCGMSQYFIRERLFRPFDTTKGNAGMGIGVFEVKEFVTGYGGNLLVDSNEGAGTVFEVKIPLYNGTDNDE